MPKVRGLFRRIAEGVAVTLGFLFVGLVAFLIWAFETGRAADAVRKELLVELREGCRVEAEFDALKLGLFPPEIFLSKLTMRRPDGQRLLSVDEVIASLRVLPLFYGRLQLANVAVLAPEATLSVENGKILNLPQCFDPDSGLLGDTRESPGSEAPPGRSPERNPPGLVLGINELTMERGSFVLFIDGEIEARLTDIGLSVSSQGTGGSQVALAIDDGTIALSERRVELRRLRVLGHIEGPLLRPRAVSLDRLDVQIGKLDVQGGGSVDLVGPVYEAKIRAVFPLEGAHEFFSDLPALRGLVEVETSLSGNLVSPRGVGTAKLQGVSVDGYGFGDQASILFSADRSGVDLRNLEIQVGKGKVQGQGRLDFDEQLSFRVETTAESLPFARVMDLVTVPGSWVDFRATGKSALSGTLLPVFLTGPFDYEVRRFRVYDRGWDSPTLERLKDKSAALMFSVPKATRCTGRWTYTEDDLTFTDSTVSVGRTRAEVEKVKIDFAAAGNLEVIAELTSLDFADLGGTIAGLSLGGTGNLRARIAGPYDDVKGTGAVELDRLTIADIPFGKASATIGWVDLTELNFAHVRGQLRKTGYEGRVGLSVHQNPKLAFSGKIERGRLEDLMIPFGLDAREWGDARGEIDARFDLAGPIRQLSGEVSFESTSISLLDEAAERAQGTLSFDQGRIRLNGLELHKHGARIMASGSVDPRTEALFFEVKSRDAHLQDIDLVRASLPNADGALAMQLTLEGTVSAVTGTLAVGLEDVRVGPERLGGGELRGLIHGSTMSILGALGGFASEAREARSETKAGRGSFKLEGELGLSRKLPYRARLGLLNLNAPALVAAVKGHRGWSGLLTASADLQGSLVDWHLSSGVIQLNEARFEAPSFELESTTNARLELEQGVLRLHRLPLFGPRTRLLLDGRIGAKLLNLEVEGRVDLALLELASPMIERAGGVISLDSTIRGEPSNLILLGKGRLEAGLLQWRGIKHRLTGFTADLSFSHSSVLIERAVGRWAGGELNARGRVLFEGVDPKDIQVAIEVSEVQPTLNFPRLDLSGVLSGGLELRGSSKRLRVFGDLDVTRGRIRLPNLDLRNLVGTAATTNVYDPSSEILDVDIGFEVKDAFRVRNDTMDVEFTGAARLTGTNQRLGMLGAASSRKGGTVLFFGREYEVETGTIQFSDRFRFNPRFELVLTTEACNARIRTDIVGTLEDQPIINSTSNPEMDEEDITSCLISGVPENLDGERIAPIASSALWQLSGVDRQVKKVIPLDQIDVSTEYSSEARAYEPRVLVAKEILDGKLRLEYSGSLVKTSDQKAALRWRLTPRLTLQAAWSSSLEVSYGDLGLDLKRRWEW